MSNLSFIKEYLTKPRTVGAVLPSSKYLANKMVKDINFSIAGCIVEYGPGTGVFTEKILENRKVETVVILLEKNENFYRQLCAKFANEQNVYIMNDSAENIGKHLAAHGFEAADYVVSGLPFASIPADISLKILTQTKKYLKVGGHFVTFQYTLMKKDFIGQFFGKTRLRWEIRNVPPAFVLSCRKR